MRAVIIDDDRTARQVARALLEKQGYQVDEASDGAAGLELLRDVGFVDLIIVDWHMEPLNGYSVIKAIRAQPHLSKSRILLITADTGAAHHRSALAAGADDCITKPLSPEVLLAAIRRFSMQFETAPLAEVKNVPKNRLFEELGPEAWTELARDFISETNTSLSRLDDAVARQDFHQVGQVAHKLAGSSAIFELEAMTSWCRKLEKAAKDADDDALSDAHCRLHEEFATSKAKLEVSINWFGEQVEEQA